MKRAVTIASIMLMCLLVLATAPCSADEFMTGMLTMPDDNWELTQIQHFDWFKSYGFNNSEPEFMWMENGISRWRAIEPQEGQFNWFALDHWVDDARKAGIKVFLDPSTYGFSGAPDWIWQKYPDIKVMAPNGATDQLVEMPLAPCQAHPGLIQETKEFAAAMAARYKDDPNVAGIIIGNERCMANVSGHDQGYYGIDYCDVVKNGFHQYLQDKYGTVSAMNSKWSKSYSSFNDVNWKGAWITQASSYRGEWLDFSLYRFKYYADYHRQINSAIKAVAPNMPTVAASISMIPNVRTAHGGEPSLFDFVDIIADKHFHGEDDRVNIQMLAQFQTDITGRPYFAINMGNIQQTYDYPMTDGTTTQMVRSTWDLIGAGSCGLMYWLWSEPTGSQMPFQSVLTRDTNGRLIVRDMVKDLGLGAQVIRRYDKLFLEMKPNPDPQIAVLDPGLTYIMAATGAMDATPNHSFPNQLTQYDVEWKELCGALQIDLYRPNHISDLQIRAGCLSKHKILALSGTDYLYADVAGKVEAWMAGSTSRYLILSKNSGKYDELGRSSTWRTRMINTYGSRVLQLNDGWQSSTLSSFVSSKVTRTFDIENGARPYVEANLLRYKDKTTNKKTAVFVLVNRKIIADGETVSNFVVRLTDPTPYQVAYSIDPRSAGVPQPLNMTRSGNDVRVSISQLKDVQLVMFSEDPQILNNADTGHSLEFDKLSEKAQWWDKNWSCRIPVQFYSAEKSGQDLILRYRPTLAGVVSLNPQRCRVIEYDRDWRMGSERPSLLRTIAGGQIEILWKMPGNTSTFKQRNFYVYFGGPNGGNDLAAPTDNAIKLEAENTVSRHPQFYVKRQYDGSGGQALNLDRPAADSGGFTATYSFAVTEAGTYGIHIRHIGHITQGGNIFPLEQFRVKLDGNQIYSQALPFDRLWKILTIPNQSLTAGQHSLEIFIQKGETEFTMDDIVIAPSSYDPKLPKLVDYTWVGTLEQPLLLSDNFNTSRFSGDINLEISNGIRQSGSLAPVDWTERAQTVTGGTNDTLTVVSHPNVTKTLGLYSTGQSWGSDITKYVWTSPDHNFTESGNIEIEVDVDPYGPGSQSGTNWAGIVLGTNVPGTYVTPTLGSYTTASSPGVGMTLGTDGLWNIYNDSASVGSGSVASHTGFYHVKISIESAGFLGTPATLTFFIDGTQVHSYTRASGFSNNYITLSGLGLGTVGYQTHFFDNLSVKTFSAADTAAPTTVASPPGGVFHWARTVELNTDEPAAIYYTTDGTEPTISSAIYTKPILIREPTTLKFFAVDASGNAETPKKQAVFTTDPLLFSDNFTPRQASQYDINKEFDLPAYDGSVRQTGALSPMTWSERPETVSGATADGATMIWHPWGAQELEFMCTAQSWGGDPNKYAWASPNHNFIESGELVIDVDVDPFAASSQPGYTNLATIIIGTNGPGTYAAPPTLGSYTTAVSPGVSFVLNGDTSWAVYDNSSTVASGNVASPHSGFYHVKIKIDTPAYTSGNAVTLSFYLDESLVHSYTRVEGFNNNYITLGGLSLHPSAYQMQFFDNFTVSAYIDKTAPTTVANPPGGVYNTGRQVTLTAGEPATIYYTTDGSTPTTSSTVYTSAISILSSTTLKFLAVDSEGNSEQPKTEIYTILDVDGTIAHVKELQNGDPVELGNKALYLKRDGFGYIEELDRSRGIRIEGTIPASEGDLVYLTGTRRTSAAGEDYIELDALSPNGTHDLAPLGANNKAAENVLADGLYLTTWGRVIAGSITSNSFVVTDGSDSDGIRVFTLGSPAVAEGEFVVVSGAAGFDGARILYLK